MTVIASGYLGYMTMVLLYLLDEFVVPIEKVKDCE
jgi:hypothetical protein